MTFSQRLYDRLTRGKSGAGKKGGETRWRRWVRRQLVRWQHDPLVEFVFDNVRIQVPLSHDVGLHWSQLPHYGRNLARLGAAVQGKYPEMTAIDIGANVGDSVAMMRTRARYPVLAIEGNPEFCEVLRQNARQMGEVEVCKAYLDAQTAQRRAQIRKQAGTAVVLTATGNEQQVSFCTLESVLESRPRFAGVRLVKVDTDGFDGLILRGAAAWLARQQPVLFFEYDLHTWGLQGDAGLDLFDELRRCGYTHLLVYDNFGELKQALQLEQIAMIEDMHRHFSHGKSEYFADLAVFAARDQDLFASFHQTELEYFKASRVG